MQPDSVSGENAYSQALTHTLLLSTSRLLGNAHCLMTIFLSLFSHTQRITHPHKHKSNFHAQAVAVQVGGGHWHYVKLQLAWVLFLLAAKSPANQALIEHLTRTVVVPLAQQLANEEAFYASEEAFTALTVSLCVVFVLVICDSEEAFIGENLCVMLMCTSRRNS